MANLIKMMYDVAKERGIDLKGYDVEKLKNGMENSITKLYENMKKLNELYLNLAI